MCETCGCGQPENYSVRVPGEVAGKPNDDNRHHDHNHEHDHHHDHDHDHHDKHDHNHKHDHHHDHDHDHPHHHGDHHENSREIDISRDIITSNNLMAERNRGFFEGRNILCLNLVSSPGSGKTAILEKTIHENVKERKMFVIEGDQQSMNDAERIKKTGVPVVQINTGSGCHLDAKMVNSALKKIEVEQNGILFIENVGNLVCPALFDLGEKKRVVVISVTEGEDKPEKYPYMFATSHLCIINKTDLLPYVDFSVEQLKETAMRVNPGLEFIPVSAKTGEGMQEWYDWLVKNRETHDR